MQSKYKPLGKYIKEVKTRNTDGTVTNLLGVNIDKYFMPSVANIVGTDMTKYKVVKKGQFACNRMHVGRDKRLPVALSTSEKDFLVSPAYDVFEIKDENILNPEYLMMWFSRKEFDRNAWFYTDADVRGGLHWKAFCEMMLPIPSLEKQKEIVAEYNTIVNRIKLNEQLNQKLEETAQAIYKQWFVDFEFPDENGNPYKSSGGEMVWDAKHECDLPKDWVFHKLNDITTKIGSGATPKGGKAGYRDNGIALVRSMNVFDFDFTYRDLAYISEKQADKLSNVVLEKDDVLLNITGVSVARCCKVPKNLLPARVNQHVAIIRLKDEYKAHNLLLCSLCSTEYKAKLLGISEGGSTRQALTKTDIEETDFLVPASNTLCKFEIIAEAIFRNKEELILHNKYLDDLRELLLASIATKSKVHSTEVFQDA